MYGDVYVCAYVPTDVLIDRFMFERRSREAAPKGNVRKRG